ncbi:MAG TPA: hypothetical protein DCM36_06205 [Xanthomonadaceae bacterium]|nr:hypothetical protein [Xanthomonadaceae bacterium]
MDGFPVIGVTAAGKTVAGQAADGFPVCGGSLSLSAQKPYGSREATGVRSILLNPEEAMPAKDALGGAQGIPSVVVGK